MSEGGITRLIFENNLQSGDSKDQFIPSNMFQSVSANTNKIYQDTFEKEKKRGFDLGYQEACAQAKLEWTDKLNLLKNLLEALDQPLKEVDEIIRQ